MSLIWVVLGTILQVFFAMFIFMLVAFSSGGIANASSPSSIQMGILTMSLYILPSLCLVSAGLVIYHYNIGGNANSYWWYVMPVVATVVYSIYAVQFNGT